jgi:hypothetical protein
VQKQKTKKASLSKKAKPLIANPTRANQRVSDTEMPDVTEIRTPRVDAVVQRAIKSWVSAKHTQMISFTPHVKFTVNTPAQRPYFRGSSLPVCPLRTALDTMRVKPRNETRHLLMDFYTGIGHVMHEMMQFWFGVDGSLYGKFQCPTCDTLYPKKSTPDDNIGMFGPAFCSGTKKKPHKPVLCKYVEFHINNLPKTGAFDGHCDGVLFIQGKYLVLEIKTTDTAKVRHRDAHGPDPKHRVQATAYRYMLPTFLGIPESKWHNFSVVIYYDRAMPRTSAVLVDPYEPQLFLDQIKTFVQTRKRIQKARFDRICGKCESIDDDHFCPYNNLCFSPHAQKLIEEILPGYRHESWAPLIATLDAPKPFAEKVRTRDAVQKFKPKSKSSKPIERRISV